MRPARGVLLVKPIDTEDKLPGGRIILVDETREKMAHYQMECVAVGAPEICEDENCQRPHQTYGFMFDGSEVESYHPIDRRITEGSWLFVQPRALIPAGSLTDRLFYVKQSEVLGVFIEEDEEPAQCLPSLSGSSE